MKHDVSTAELVQNLRRVGLRPSDRTIEAILARSQDAVAPLLEVALDTEALMGPEPDSLGPVHALRLLGELKASSAAEPLLNAVPLPVPEQGGQGGFLWSQEVPQIVANFGADVWPIALRIVDDLETPPLRRGAAYATLSFLATTTPELRADIVAALRERLDREPDNTARGYIVAALAQLQAREAYAEVMEAFKARRVDRTIMAAADARRLMLGTQTTRQLDCALHSLSERYDQHGPYSEEQQRAMADMARRGNM